MSPHVIWSSLIVAGCLSIGCGREQAANRDTREQPASQDTRDRDAERVFEAAKDGLDYLQKKASENETARAKQVEKLDSQIARIQKLFEAGKYDEGELLLVDIHWIPIEPGARSEARFVQTYDEKRQALTRFLESKRPVAR